MGQAMPKAPSEYGQTSAELGALRDRLWHAALALTRSREDAEDLTQQTLATVLAKQPDCLEHVGFLRRTMFRLWLDEQRSLRRRVRRMARVVMMAAAGRPSPEGDDDVAYGQIVHAIEALPPQQHAVTVLRLIDGLDYDEIAAVLECSVATVRSNLHLARARIRRTIGERE